MPRWEHYNHKRPHQSIAMVTPFERFRVAATEQVTPEVSAPPEVDPTPSAATRRVGANGLISFAAAKYRAGVWLAGQDVTVVCDGGLVHLQHRSVLIATHARRHSVTKQVAGLRRAKEKTYCDDRTGVCPRYTIEPRFRAMVLLAAFTGLRLGELRALRRSKLDIARTKVQVVEQTQELADGTLL